MDDKNIKRVLWLSDFTCSTGFATVAHNILHHIIKSEKYQVDVIAINYYGMPNEWQKLYPMVRVLPATVISNGDLFGRQGLLNLLGTGVYDIVFTLQDTFQMELVAPKMIETRNVLKQQGAKTFEWIYYYPIDAAPKENWIKNSVALADYPVAYTQYGVDETLKHADIASKLDQIPHGYNPDMFFPLSDEEKKKFRKDYFLGKADGKYLVTNVNRNQMRKDLPRTLLIFKHFKKQVPNALLYLHCKENDVGGSINEIARNYELIQGDDYILPADFNENKGVPVQILNAIYNVSDVVMTTTLGEGWGLSMTEAMACKTPVIAPNHTSLKEMLDGRGTLVTSGRSLTDWFVLPADNERLRPLVDVAEYVDKLVKMHHNKQETIELADKAYNYVTENLKWETVCKRWVDIFEKASTKLPEVGRNEPCSCGSGKKFKHCHG